MKDPWHFLIQLDYEEGAPKEIFNNPKKDKTRLFIHNLKEVHWSIKNSDSMSIMILKNVVSEAEFKLDGDTNIVEGYVK